MFHHAIWNALTPPLPQKTTVLLSNLITQRIDYFEVIPLASSGKSWKNLICTR
jgi:hypothetical protein